MTTPKEQISRIQAATPMVFQCCGREACDGKDCPNNGPWYQVPKWRMSGYYYGFEPTGLAPIDRVLSAVACAGKAYHHTDQWENDVGEGYYEHLRGSTPAEWIQNAAIDALAYAASLEEQNAKLREAAEVVIKSRDERSFTVEEFKTDDLLPTGYWSPAASMVDSEAISKLRAALSKPQGVTS
ncbi:MAG: hypothetical protein HYX42_00065 [Polaromonas sp.]|uniref:hypothetical protein n=1 Tax=Polaromonas sp. TaxID=1869339 RepID=UPI0025DD817C|nr:hypothetical protein [Polaromonas sp.]MBI2724622.1 hypothetical protein [Polaromonas sp.]